MIGCPCGVTVPRTRYTGHVTVCALQQLRRHQEAAVHAETRRLETGR
jgi:hypothetical protein